MLTLGKSAKEWTDDQVDHEHRPLWKMSADSRWHPLNDAAKKLISNGRNGKQRPEEKELRTPPPHYEDN